MPEPINKSKIVVPPPKALQKPKVTSVKAPEAKSVKVEHKTNVPTKPKPTKTIPVAKLKPIDAKKVIAAKNTNRPKSTVVPTTVKKGMSTAELFKRMQLDSANQFK